MSQKTLEDVLYSDEGLQDATFLNILYFRHDEIQRILNGERATLVIPESNQRSKLLRDGVLIEVYRQGGKCIEVSPDARRVLETMRRE